MPVIFAIDCSLSMFMPLHAKDPNDTIINACKHGILSAVDFLSHTYHDSIQVALVYKYWWIRNWDFIFLYRPGILWNSTKIAHAIQPRHFEMFGTIEFDRVWRHVRFE